jgi:hypothetical protein
LFGESDNAGGGQTRNNGWAKFCEELMKAFLMNQPTQGAQSNAHVRRRTWAEAYRAFLLNPRELLTVKLLPLIAMGILPLSMADDVLLPFIGVADDIPTAIIVGFVVLRTWQRVRRYR